MAGSGSSEFKNRLQAGCRAARREKLDWRRQAGNTSQYNLRQGFRRFRAWLLPTAVTAIVAIAVGRQTVRGELEEPAVGLALGSLCLWLYSISRSKLAHACYADNDLVAYALLPVSNEWIARRQLRKWLRSVLPLGLTCVIGFLAAGV
jgi:hypothetical protein